MSDERHGCPSASSLPRLAKCPGSWRLSRITPPEESSEEAASGTRIHDALAGANVTLTSDEEVILGTLRTLEESLLGEWLGEDPPGRVIRETRFWRKVGETALWSAKPDLVVLRGDAALVVEYKTGPLAVEDASANLQLRAQAAVVGHTLPGIRRVTVAVLQPRCSPQITRCAYHPRDLKKALTEIDGIVAQTQWEDAPLRAGSDQCRYCPAKAICPEAHAEVTALTTTQSDPPTPAHLAMLLDRCVLAEQIIESIRDHARRLLSADPTAVPGWRLVPGRNRETITKLQQVFERVHRLGAQPEVFIGVCSLSKKALKSLLESVTRERGALLDARLGSVIEGCVEVSQTRPMLERCTGAVP